MALYLLKQSSVEQLQYQGGKKKYNTFPLQFKATIYAVLFISPDEKQKTTYCSEVDFFFFASQLKIKMHKKTLASHAYLDHSHLSYKD